MKYFSNRSNARRALGKMGEQYLAHADVLLVQEEGTKRFGFDEVDLCMVDNYGAVNCPHCGIHLQNGVNEGDVRVHMCLGCGEEFGEELRKAAPVKAEPQYRIEKGRPTQNDVTMPSEGTKCRAVWDLCDELVNKGTNPTPSLMKEMAIELEWNVNNTVIEMYQWRKFHGIASRRKAAA